MTIIINKNDGSTQLTINNFTNLNVDAETVDVKIADPTASEKDATIIKFQGADMKIRFQYIIGDETSNVVSGTGSPVTNGRDQFKYLFNTLMSTGSTSISDKYRLLIKFNNTALDSGTATAGTSTTLTDGGKSWTVNQYAGQVLTITSGTGAGQMRTITSNTATALTIDSSDNFSTNPDNTSQYQIIDGFERQGVITHMTPQMSSDRALTFTCDVQFDVGSILA